MLKGEIKKEAERIEQCKVIFFDCVFCTHVDHLIRIWSKIGCYTLNAQLGYFVTNFFNIYWSTECMIKTDITCSVVPFILYCIFHRLNYLNFLQMMSLLKTFLRM